MYFNVLTDQFKAAARSTYNEKLSRFGGSYIKDWMSPRHVETNGKIIYCFAEDGEDECGVYCPERNLPLPEHVTASV